MPRAFSRIPHSFSIWARALPKLSAALDNVLPLVQVFSAPYFLLSSDNLVPVEKVLCILSDKTNMNLYPNSQKNLKQHTYFNLLRTSYNITFHATDNLLLIMLLKKKTKEKIEATKVMWCHNNNERGEE